MPKLPNHTHAFLTHRDSTSRRRYAKLQLRRSLNQRRLVPAPLSGERERGLLCKTNSLTAADKMNWSNETTWQIGRAWRSGCCLAIVYCALMEFQGELSPWLVSIGIAAVGIVWAKIWLAPRRNDPLHAD
jgi:hypothetical protein